MLGKSARILLVGLIALLFVAPAMSMPGGPPWMSGSNLTVEVGCTCHGDGVPSPNVIVSISGVPRAYESGETYRSQFPTRCREPRRWFPNLGLWVRNLYSWRRI